MESLELVVWVGRFDIFESRGVVSRAVGFGFQLLKHRIGSSFISL